MNEKVEDAASVTAPAAAAAPETNVTDYAAMEQQLSTLKTENAELKDRLLRTLAEMENFRRRADREKSDVMKYATTAFSNDIVTMGDNLRRAIQAAQKEPLDANPALKTLLEGVEATEREMIKVFERHGITRFEPLGEKFDPHLHEALIKIDVPNVAAETIVQVLHAGYKIGDRVLRPAAVIVAQGGTAARPVEPDLPLDLMPESFVHAPDEVKAKPAGNPQPPINKPANVSTKETEQDPDVLRDTNAAPRNANGPQPGVRKERQAHEKRTVTTPVTENNNAAPKHDDLMSTFGKRFETGS